MTSNNDDADGLSHGAAANEGAGRDIENGRNQKGNEFNDTEDTGGADTARYDSERLSTTMSPTDDASNDLSDDGNGNNNARERTHHNFLTDEFYSGDEDLANNVGTTMNRMNDDVGDKKEATTHSQQSDPQSVPIASCRASFRNQKQDEFVKNGARVKALLSTVLRVVADGITPSNATAGSDGNAENESTEATKLDSDNHHSKTKYTNADFANVRTVAQERSEECLALKRKLEGLQSQIDFFQNEITISHQTNTQLKGKLERTVEALEHAGANAANARAEADASNARAESLSSQLNDLQTMIEETKRGMEVVRREHDEVSRSTRNVEDRLIQVESEFVRAARTKRDAIEERDLLKARAESSEKVARELQDQVDDYHNELRLLKKDLIEKEDMEQMRFQRTRSIETEVEVARASLLEATSAAVEAESTVASLRSVIEVLQRENKTLHGQMNESRDSFSKDRSKLNEALLIAEREAQKWKMKCEEVDEEIRKLTMDKTSAEKQVEQLKCRLENRRINNDTSEQLSSRLNTTAPALQAVTPHDVSNNLGFINSFGANDISVVTEESKKRTYVTELPMRESSTNNASQLSSSSRQLTYAYQKEDHDSVSHRSMTKRPGDRINICCLCSKEGGMILKCQCDNINCDKRAHAICIGKFRSSDKDDSSRTILCKKTRCG